MDPSDRKTDRSQHAVNFWCDVEGNGGAVLKRDPRGGFVFTGNMSSMGNKTLMSAGDGQRNVKMSLRICDFNGDGKTVTCDLKLTTGSDLKIKNKQLNQICLPYYSLVF